MIMLGWSASLLNGFLRFDTFRTGEVEVTRLQDKYERVFMAWQFLQIQDCHLRSKYHSKWTAFIDIDERIAVNGQKMVEVLRSIQDPTVGDVQLQSLSVVRDQDYPEKYLNLEELDKELIFKKFNDSIDPVWQGLKTIIRPNKVVLLILTQKRELKWFSDWNNGYTCSSCTVSRN